MLPTPSLPAGLSADPLQTAVDFTDPSQYVERVTNLRNVGSSQHQASSAAWTKLAQAINRSSSLPPNVISKANALCAENSFVVAQEAAQFSTCMAPVVADLMMDQVNGQLYCFQSYFGFLVDMGNHLAGCVKCNIDIACHQDVFVGVTKTVVTDNKAVTQTYQHIPVAMKHLRDARTRCLAPTTQKLMSAQSECNSNDLTLSRKKRATEPEWNSEENTLEDNLTTTTTTEEPAPSDDEDKTDSAEVAPDSSEEVVILDIEEPHRFTINLANGIAPKMAGLVNRHSAHFPGKEGPPRPFQFDRMPAGHKALFAPNFQRGNAFKDLRQTIKDLQDEGVSAKIVRIARPHDFTLNYALNPEGIPEMAGLIIEH